MAGGFSTGPGQAQIVTPSGQAIGSAVIPGGGGSGALPQSQPQQQQNGGWYNGVQYWAPGQGPQSSSSNNNNSGGGQPALPDINSLYQPQIDFLNGLTSTINNTKTQQLGGIDTQYTGQQKQIGDQSAMLNQQLSTDQSTFGNQMQSAYAQAASDYQALKQRNAAMFGGQSSAGPAADELLGQTYLQTQNGLQNSQLQGNQQFQQEGLGITQWGQTQQNQLDTWKSQAYDMINNTAQQGLNAINQDLAMTESDKTQAKLQLLQQVVNHRQALEDYSTQLTGQLQAAMAMSGANVQNFNSQPFLNAMQGISTGIGGQMQGLNQMSQVAGLTPQQAQQYQYYLSGSNNNQDRSSLQMAGLLPQGLAQ
jgi:hypothetical protein